MPKKIKKVVALGDSITFGFPFSPKESWVEVVKMKTEINIINKGINGDLTSDMLHRFTQDVIKECPSHVIILGGANDAYSALSKESVIENVKSICKLAEENCITPILGIPTPINDKWEEYRLSGYRSLMQGYAEDKGYDVINFYSHLLDKESGGIKDGFHVDGLHPSIDGYRAMAEAAIRYLRLSNL